MERSAASTLTTARGLPATGSGEPGHLHLDRGTRRWLAHAASGMLQPYSSAEKSARPALAKTMSIG